MGAGVGEHVFFVRGKEASFPFHPDRGAGRRRHRRHRRSLDDGGADDPGARRRHGRLDQKRPQFEGAKLLLVQPETPQGEPRGATLLAIDSVGAGVSERVLVVIEGRAAGEALGKKLAPVDAAIIGIVDEIDVEAGG